MINENQHRLPINQPNAIQPDYRNAYKNRCSYLNVKVTRTEKKNVNTPPKDNHTTPPKEGLGEGTFFRQKQAKTKGAFARPAQTLYPKKFGGFLCTQYSQG